MPSAIASRRGVSASTPINRAPASAIGVMTSIPSTQLTVDVERATVRVSRRTSSIDQKRPAPIDSRIRSHSIHWRPAVSSKAASGPISRVSGDTYRIPGPHEAGEVVTGSDDVQVDVLAEVEARVLVRSAERSEEHTSELQSRGHLVCRLL